MKKGILFCFLILGIVSAKANITVGPINITTTLIDNLNTNQFSTNSPISIKNSSKQTNNLFFGKVTIDQDQSGDFGMLVFTNNGIVSFKIMADDFLSGSILKLVPLVDGQGLGVYLGGSVYFGDGQTVYLLLILLVLQIRPLSFLATAPA
jgi:hypothetical protein